MEDKLNSSFTAAANALSAFYKESLQEEQAAFERGKGTFYQETLEWMLQAGGGDLRYISVDALEDYIRDYLELPRRVFPQSYDGHTAKKFRPFE